jgi:hypothetical protein
MGFARRFRPMYADANMGHPSDFLRILLGSLRDRCPVVFYLRAAACCFVAAQSS